MQRSNNTITEMKKNHEHFEWKFDGTRYIPIVRENPVAYCKHYFASSNFFLCLWGGCMITSIIIFFVK